MLKEFQISGYGPSQFEMTFRLILVYKGVPQHFLPNSNNQTIQIVIEKKQIFNTARMNNVPHMNSVLKICANLLHTSVADSICGRSKYTKIKLKIESGIPSR
jgi:hypothetical protein